ncbi:hypothetical protein J4573_15100 [Actinomadura barringtoniae]|uniref:Uncharacterized protein n=1 Tax=Actinomadura barringtoniae TaxID=1427535 RepID=A0A939PA97_9ACTN|nr:hypothetical protein [Actinomadura barringtoniae]MBO2448427.1 hypothetical protein [Actinomadura barringtoniae]
MAFLRTAGAYGVTLSACFSASAAPLAAGPSVPDAHAAPYPQLRPAPYAAPIARADCVCWRLIQPDGTFPDSTLGEVTTPADGTGWAAGSRGEAPLLLGWNGHRWHERRIPLPADTLLEGVSAVSGKEAWAVGLGKDGTGRTAHLSGAKWVKGSLPGGRPVVPRAVEARTPNEAWVVGSTGGIAGNRAAAWRWNGKAWAAVPVRTGSGGNSELMAISSRSSEDAWAVGSAAPARQLLMRWNGKAWKSVNGPDLHGESTLADVVALESGEAWAVGTASPGPAGSASEVPLAERWDGKAWKVVEVPGVNGRFYSVAADGGTGIWAAGEDDAAHPLLAHWDGIRWDVSRPTLPQGADQGEVWAISHIPGTPYLRAVGWYARPGDRQRHAVTWTNSPRPR